MPPSFIFTVLGYYLFIIAIILVIYFLINRWIMKYLEIKQEQNQLLREIIQALERKKDN